MDMSNREAPIENEQIGRYCELNDEFEVDSLEYGIS